MGSEDKLTPREAMEREKARLLEEATAKAAAIDRDMAEIERLGQLAAKYGLVVTSADISAGKSTAMIQAAHEAATEPRKTKVKAFDGSVASLIACYKADENASYSKLRHKTRGHYDYLMGRIEADVGTVLVKDIDAKRLKQIYESWLQGGRIAMAHSLAGMLRGLAVFGATVLKNKECRELKFIIHEAKFQVAKPRNAQLTAEQAAAIIHAAHAMGRPSIALAQALQFECRLHQRDVIGEWVPMNEPGESDVFEGEQKWLRGMLWSEIDRNLVLRHPASRGGQLIEVRLSDAKMVMTEFAKLGPQERTGPVIINEKTGYPYVPFDFRRLWRLAATAAGVPENVFNKDSRADLVFRSRRAPVGLRVNGHAVPGSQIAEVPVKD
jgi:hypothetical protein